jgi:hypothetical protein
MGRAKTKMRFTRYPAIRVSWRASDEWHMTYAIIRGKNGRRHEVDFGDSPVRVEVYASEATIEIFVEADFESLPEERRRFALVNVPVCSLAKRQAKLHATGQEKIAEMFQIHRCSITPTPLRCATAHRRRRNRAASCQCGDAPSASEWCASRRP